MEDSWQTHRVHNALKGKSENDFNPQHAHLICHQILADIGLPYP